MSGYFIGNVYHRIAVMRVFVAIFFSVVMLSFVDVSVQQQASFVEEPQNVTVKEGETAVLRCLLDREVRDCSWQRDGATFAMGDRYNYAPDTNDGRSTSNCSIVIVGFKQQLDGVAWNCVILGGSNSPTRISTAAYLIALVQPTDPVIQLNRNTVSQLSYPLRGATELTCVSRRGNPAAELSWDLDGQPVDGLYAKQRIASSPSDPSQVIDSPLYDAILTFDLMNDGSRLERAKQIKCIVKHPSYPQPIVLSATITRDYPTMHVRAHIEGSNESTLEVESDRKVTLFCDADGRPPPKYEWQYRVDESVEWGAFDVTQNVTIVGRGGMFRCRASNRLNTKLEPLTTQEIVLRVKIVAEGSSMGLLVGIIIAIVVVIALVLLIVLLLYRRKSWVFAPKPIASSTDKDTEAANGGDLDKPDEKTALSQESPYDNVNGKDDEMNGKKPGDSPVKNDQNANKQPTEVVYAQLDLVNTAPKTTTTASATSPTSPPEYEKTEYAEIRFNNKENQV